MADVRLEDIRLFLCDPRVQVRSSLRMALNDAGLRNANIWEGGELDAINDAVSDPNGPDIIICDVTANTDEACEIFHGIRHNELGTNPFVCIIAVAWSPKQPLVNKVVDSGADLLVAAPISPSVILDRIDSLVHNRKPFVVTTDYVGPDRRFQKDRPSDVKHIDVPNSLRDKALGKFDAAALKERIRATRESIVGQKIDRHAFQVAYLADMITQEFKNDTAENASNQLRDLRKVTAELKKKAAAMDAREIKELCTPLATVTEKLITSKGDFKKKDIELLGQLSLAIRAAVKPGNAASSLARDISKTVIGAGAAR